MILLLDVLVGFDNIEVGFITEVRTFLLKVYFIIILREICLHLMN